MLNPLAVSLRCQAEAMVQLLADPEVTDAACIESQLSDIGTLHLFLAESLEAVVSDLVPNFLSGLDQ